MITNINKKRLAYGLFLVIFFVYLYNANNIVVSFVGESVKEINIDEIPQKDEVTFYIDNFYGSSSLEEKIYFKGWAFCETTEENNDKQISLIFVSDSSAYEYKMRTVNREDVVSAYRPSKKINGIKHGFAGDFTTIPMKPGIYELYIYVWENDNGKVV